MAEYRCYVWYFRLYLRRCVEGIAPKIFVFYIAELLQLLFMHHGGHIIVFLEKLFLQLSHLAAI